MEHGIYDPFFKLFANVVNLKCKNASQEPHTSVNSKNKYQLNFLQVEF